MVRRKARSLSGGRVFYYLTIFMAIDHIEEGGYGDRGVQGVWEGIAVSREKGEGAGEGVLRGCVSEEEVGSYAS